MLLSPSTFVPSYSGRNIIFIASAAVHPSAVSAAAASVSLVDTSVLMSPSLYLFLIVSAAAAIFFADAGSIPVLFLSTSCSMLRGI